MLKEICIDNGGTLTDVCVFDGADVFAAKTLTTPFDLSQCFFDGLAKAARGLYGEDDVERLLRETAVIRYSTTQGTNALVERKGPRLGLVLDAAVPRATLAPDGARAALFDALVGARCVAFDAAGGLGEEAVISAANALAEQGVSRILVCFAGPDYVGREQEFVAHYENRFPPHNLGTVPVAVAHETGGDAEVPRRIWTALLNAFLHPPMERFLFNAQKRLRSYRSPAAFRIYRNDGGSAKVAKTIAIRTYSSGPRGGLEAVRATALRRGFGHVIAVDVGGTTSDVSVVAAGAVPAELRGRVEGVATSLELPRIESLGIGGGSIVRVVDGVVHVGPESVGAAPGPACFGLGGTRATITDACVARGLIDPESFSGIERPLDRARAEAAVANEIGTPLGLATPAAAHLICDRWIASLAAGIRAHEPPRHDTVLMAFGGAGPLAICEVATALGIRRVFVPKLAALFSAYGVRYAHLGQDYELTLPGLASAAREGVLSAALATAARDMAGEGLAIADCTITARAVMGEAAVDVPLEPARWPAAAESIQLRVSAGLPAYEGPPGTAAGAVEAATPAGERIVLGREGGLERIPIHRHAELTPGMRAAGPALVQSDYFLCHLVAGWRFTVLDGGDLLLEAGDQA